MRLESLTSRPDALRLAHVSVAYQSHVVVEDVSFEVQPGECFCIVGENGSGKSTLLKAIVGIVPAKGEIVFGAPRHRVGYVPQSSGIQKGFPATVWEVALTGRQRRGRPFSFYSAEDRSAVEITLQRLEIFDIRNRLVCELSGGQLQRTLIARALCSAPQLLILDEPTAGLDAMARFRLAELLRELKEEDGLTILMVTHDRAEVTELADRVAVMDGHLCFCGTVQEWTCTNRIPAECGV